jgi:hypothetical protein
MPGEVKVANNVNMRATFYIPQDLDLRMEQMALDLRLTHGVKVSKSELVRGAMELFLSMGPARIYEILV